MSKTLGLVVNKVNVIFKQSELNQNNYNIPKKKKNLGGGTQLVKK